MSTQPVNLWVKRRIHLLFVFLLGISLTVANRVSAADVDTGSRWSGAAQRYAVVAHCSGFDQVMTGQLSVSGNQAQLRLDGEPTLPALKTTTPPRYSVDLSGEYVGTVDEWTGTISLAPAVGSVNKPRFEGLRASQTGEIAAHLIGRVFQKCSHVVFLPTTDLTVARDILAKKMKTRQRVSTRREKCRKGDAAWLESVAAEVSRWSKPMNRVSHVASIRAAALYAEPGFSQRFGKTFRNLSEKQAHRLHNVGYYRTPCGTEVARSDAAQYVLALKPLTNDPEFGRGQVLVNNRASKVYIDWAKSFASATRPSGLTVAEAQKQLDAMRPVSTQVELFLGNSEFAGTGFGSSTAAIAQSAFNDELSRWEARSALSLDELETLAQITDSGSGLLALLDTESTATLVERITRAVNQRVLEALPEHLSNLEGMDGFEESLTWRRKFPNVSSTIRRGTELDADRLAEQHAASIEQRLVVEYERIYAQRVNTSTSALERLAIVVAARHEQSSLLKSFVRRDAASAFRAALRKDYDRFLDEARGDIAALISRSSSTQNVDSVLATYLLRAGQKTAAEGELQMLAAQRRAFINEQDALRAAAEKSRRLKASSIRLREYLETRKDIYVTNEGRAPSYCTIESTVGATYRLVCGKHKFSINTSTMEVNATVRFEIPGKSCSWTDRHSLSLAVDEQQAWRMLFKDTGCYGFRGTETCQRTTCRLRAVPGQPAPHFLVFGESRAAELQGLTKYRGWL